MTETETVTETELPIGSSPPRTFVGFPPSSVVLFVAATCVVGMFWGAIDRNWVLLATEVPAVLALVGVWYLTRADTSRSDGATAAIVIGLACTAEVWVATTVFNARGLQLAIVVAISSAVTTGLGAAYWLRRRSRPSHL